MDTCSSKKSQRKSGGFHKFVRRQTNTNPSASKIPSATGTLRARYGLNGVMIYEYTYAKKLLCWSTTPSTFLVELA